MTLDIPLARPANLPLPRSHEDAHAVFWRPDDSFVDALADALRGKRVLEVFAGNGYLAALLAQRGVEVTATSWLTGMDGHERGLYHPVIPMGALDAAIAFRHTHDAMLMCWPTVTSAALLSAMAFGPGRPIAYIGEATDYSKGHLGGCADDNFHELFVFDSELPYRGNMLERAGMGRIGPAATLDRSAPKTSPRRAPR
jgi:hypothetical protein